jgi:hypothetical protein
MKHVLEKSVVSEGVLCDHPLPPLVLGIHSLVFFADSALFSCPILFSADGRLASALIFSSTDERPTHALLFSFVTLSGTSKTGYPILTAKLSTKAE